MFLLKIIIFFVLITISMLCFFLALGNPLFIVPVLILTPLALYIVGFTTMYASPKAQVENYEKEIKNYYSSPNGKFRDIFVGFIGASLGFLGLYLIFLKGNFMENISLLVFSIFFMVIGVFLIYTALFPSGITSPKFSWADPTFHSLLIFQKYNEAEKLLYKHAEKSGMNIKQKRIFINHGKSMIKNAKLARNNKTN